MRLNFALTGASGYIAPRHLKAISETGNDLVACIDPHDSVGILDKYFFNTRYFQEFERFDRYVEKLRRKGEESRIHYVSICSPNYLHDAHIRFALRVDANAICEKPLVINPWNIDPLSARCDDRCKCHDRVRNNHWAVLIYCGWGRCIQQCTGLCAHDGGAGTA